jgi:Ca2+/Na+ antiporter
MYSHDATSITDGLSISDTRFGLVVLAIAITLSEKCIAVMGGHRGHAGILVANTAGGNIFLLTLYIGIVMLDTKGSFKDGRVRDLSLGFYKLRPSRSL